MAFRCSIRSFFYLESLGKRQAALSQREAKARGKVLGEVDLVPRPGSGWSTALYLDYAIVLGSSLTHGGPDGIGRLEMELW
jgi:hypothetical protein